MHCKRTQKKAGYDVTREFYINDAGNQIERFGMSLEARYLQHFAARIKLSSPRTVIGEDIIEHVKSYIDQYGISCFPKPLRKGSRLWLTMPFP